MTEPPLFFAFGGRSHEYHHGDAKAGQLLAICGEGERPAKGAPTWATRDDVPARLEECQACAKQAAVARLPDGVAEPLGDCRTCGLGVARFPEGPLHQRLDGTFTVKGRGGCKAPIVKGSRVPPPVRSLADLAAITKEDPPAPPILGQADVDGIAQRQHEAAREPMVRLVPPKVERCPHGVAIDTTEPCPPCDVAAGIHAGPPAAAVGSPDWYAGTVRAGCDMLRRDVDAGDWREAARTAEALLFLAQRAADRQASKKPPGD